MKYYSTPILGIVFMTLMGIPTVQTMPLEAVASPTLQAEIEEHLHQARTLITQAHEAADQGDPRQVEHLIQQVRVHTAHAVEGSQESKP